MSHAPGHTSIRWQSCWGFHFNLLVHSYIINCCQVAGWGERLGGREEKEAEKKKLDIENESTSQRDKNALWGSVSTWRLCRSRRQMRSLNPSAQMGTLWGRLYANAMMQWGEICLREPRLGSGRRCSLCSGETGHPLRGEDPRAARLSSLCF